MTDWPLKRSEDILPNDDSLVPRWLLSFLRSGTRDKVAGHLAGTAVKSLLVNTGGCCRLVCVPACDCVQHQQNSAALLFRPKHPDFLLFTRPFPHYPYHQ